MSPADVPSAFIRSHRSRRVAIAVFKVLGGESVCRWHRLLLLIQCISQALTTVEQSKEENDQYVFIVFLFCTGLASSSCIFFVKTVTFSLINIRCKEPMDVFSPKKKNCF